MAELRLSDVIATAIQMAACEEPERSYVARTAHNGLQPIEKEVVMAVLCSGFLRSHHHPSWLIGLIFYIFACRSLPISRFGCARRRDFNDDRHPMHSDKQIPTNT